MILFFRHSGREIDAPPDSTVYVSNPEPAPIKLTNFIRNEPPRLLCILDNANQFSIKEGDLIGYEFGQYVGAILIVDGNATVVEAIDIGGGSWYFTGAPSSAATAYVYVQGDSLWFEENELEVEESVEKVEWFGRNTYILHADNVWRHSNCLIYDAHQRTDYFPSPEFAGAIAGNSVEMANEAVKDLLKNIGMCFSDQYFNISKNIVDYLCEIANHYQISWTVAVKNKRKAFGKHEITYNFTWNLPLER